MFWRFWQWSNFALILLFFLFALSKARFFFYGRRETMIAQFDKKKTNKQQKHNYIYFNLIPANLCDSSICRQIIWAMYLYCICIWNGLTFRFGWSGSGGGIITLPYIDKKKRRSFRGLVALYIRLTSVYFWPFVCSLIYAPPWMEMWSAHNLAYYYFFHFHNIPFWWW